MNNQTVSPWKKLSNLLQLEKRDILQVLYYAIFGGLISLTLPLGIQAIINLIQGAQVSTSWILLTVLVTLGVGFVGALQVLQLDIVENIQEKVFARASFDFIYKLPKIRIREFEHKYPPELANRFFDVLILQKGLQKLLLDFPTAVIQIIFGLLLLSLYHPFFIGLGILMLILLYLFFKLSLDRAVKTSIEESKKKYQIAFWIQQVAKNFKMFKISSNSFEQDKNNQLVQNYIDARQDHFGVVKKQFKQMVFFKIVITLGLLLIGGLLVLNQQMNIGQFVAAEIIILLVINSVEKIVLSLETIYDVVTAIEKIDEVSSKKLDVKNVDRGDGFSIFPIEVKNLSSKHKQIKDFKIQEKQVLNIVGGFIVVRELFNYLAGFKKSLDGKIYLDKKEISSIDLGYFHEQIAVVSHEGYLFEGTIWENLILNNPNVKSEEVYKYLEAFEILEDIQNLEDTVNSQVYPGINFLSIKTAKKIALIRALLKRPKLLFIEDNFIESKNELDYLLEVTKNNGGSILLASSQKLDETIEIVSLTS
jgi:ABC-type bacteriocin/lantibiotic exporter with double-glycine peptidase domain